MPGVEVVAFSVLLFCAATAHANPDDPYYRLIYDYEVASFCGLVKSPVHRAYKEKRRDLEVSSDLSPKELTQIRVGAMADAEREYINRGLGGHKPWCRNQGMAGIGRIVE
ncbi:MAG: hypothetical protein WD075_02975 [Rhodospirillales bacterium]